jgi:hypothetical protein
MARLSVVKAMPVLVLGWVAAAGSTPVSCAGESALQVVLHTGQTEEIRSVAISGDGKYVATGSMDWSPQDQAPTINAEDEKTLQQVVANFLFDPQGAQRVRLAGTEAEGWLVKAKAGIRVYFTDGESIEAPPQDKMTKIDFVARCRELYRGEPGPRQQGFFRERLPSRQNRAEEVDLVLAAWLYRLGEKELAARVLQFIPSGLAEEVGAVREHLARSAWRKMLDCFKEYEDDAAWIHGERLLRLFEPEADKLEQPPFLMEDLKRRKQQGIGGKKGPVELPKESATWDRNKQIAYLIEALDGIKDRAEFVIGSASREPRLQPLFAPLLDEAAVPALLDALENDERFTRYFEEPWHRDYEGIGRMQSVRDVALRMLFKILRTEHIDPRAEKSIKRWYGREGLMKAGAAARAYWNEFGQLPFEERMLRVLGDARCNFPAYRDAARGLAGGSWLPRDVNIGRPNPAILNFTKPTVAETILFVLERDLERELSEVRRNPKQSRENVEWPYLCALIHIGDHRIAPDLANRASREQDLFLRVQWAHAAYRLREPEPLKQFAAALAAAELDIAETRKAGDLHWIIEYLSTVSLSEVDRALFKLADAKHPWHALIVDDLIRTQLVYGSSWYLGHPYCLPLLRKLLDDKKTLNVTVMLGDNGVLHANGWSILPPILADPKNRKSKVEMRRCDMAGQLLARLVSGIVDFHPLVNDADARLADMARTLDKYAGRFRRLTEAEQLALAQHCYVPDIRPLDRPATAADVESGKAVFHLDGKGKLGDVRLPLVATWPAQSKKAGLRKGLIVQAELRPDGEVVYGVVEYHSIRAVLGSELATVTSLPKVGLPDGK